MSRPLSLRWPEELVARIDEARGLVPRAAWIRGVVLEALEGRPAAPVRDVMLGDRPVAQRPVSGSRDDRLAVAKAAMQRGHLSTCRCPVCKPPKGSG